MKAVIVLDVPEWQIGQDVSVYFPDTMLKHGKCEILKEQEEQIPVVVRCKDCKHGEPCKNGFGDDAIEVDYFIKALKTRLKYCPNQKVGITLSAESARRILKALKENRM